MAARTDSHSIAGHAVDRSYLPLLFTLGLGVFAGALDLGVLSPALPALAATFAVDARAIAWVYTLYLLANVASIPVASKLSDSYGRRPVYIACVATFAAGSLLAILAPRFDVFLAARAIQAIGAGGIFPVATAAIADTVPAERRGSALGLVAATWGLAAILGPNVGAILTHFLGWHWIFAANLPLALIVIVLANAHVPAAAARRRGPLDFAGIAFLIIGLLATMVALTRLDARAASLGENSSTFGSLFVAVMAFVMLAKVEARAPEPIVSPILFRDRQLVTTYVLEVVIGALEGALFFIPAALVAAQHLALPAAGAIAAIGAFVFVAVIPISGRALDTFGSRAVLAVGSTLTAAGLALFALTLGSTWLSIAAMVVAGCGFGALLGAPTRYIVTTRVSTEMRATAVGLLSIFLIIGQIFGGSLAGGIIGSHADRVPGYREAYLVFATLGIVAIALTMLLASRAREHVG